MTKIILNTYFIKIHNDQKDYQIDDKHFHLSITYPDKEIDIGSVKIYFYSILC